MNQQKQRYFAVSVKCGHVGNRYYIPITFPVIAPSASDAAAIVSQFPRVKHHHKDRILAIESIDRNCFDDLLKNNNRDPYLKATSIQQQRCWLPDIEQRLVEEKIPMADAFEVKKLPSVPRKPIFRGKIKIKKAKAFQRLYSDLF
jgi:hypothetical protein